ncbi:MAG: fibronectin type III domain-containing protein [Ignavibacteria bacterium]|nr:fibronectin type III domain-containing protein [Ignavibacteria bacterium]
MKVRNTFLHTSLILALTIAIVACNENTTTPAEPQAPQPPTGLAATSIDSVTVGLKWTAPATGVTPTGYEISYKVEGTSEVFTTQVSGSTLSTLISSLVENTVYEFTVKAKNDTARSAATLPLKWAPAKRYSSSIILYEHKSSFGSGLNLPAFGGLTVDNGDLWDLAFDVDTSGTKFYIGSPGSSSYTDDNGVFVVGGDVARTTLIGLVWTNVPSLNDVYESVDLASSATLEEVMVDFTADDAARRQIAFVVKTESGNFAKVMIKKNVDGRLIRGSAPDRYIEVEVSYQEAANIPYASVENRGPFPRSKNIRYSTAQ